MTAERTAETHDALVQAVERLRQLAASSVTVALFVRLREDPPTGTPNPWTLVYGETGWHLVPDPHADS